MLLEMTNVHKSFGARTVISLNRFVLYRGDKVAVVGPNGAGKTTFLRLITGEEEPDEGRITLRGRTAIIAQFGGGEDPEAHSGGEKTAARIAAALSEAPDLLLADEPTTNLDIDGIMKLEGRLCAFGGALLLVSHDRVLLENLCTKILEIENGVCRLYPCGYAEYAAQKMREKAAHEAKFEAYTAEKSRLIKAAEEKTQQSARIKKPPKRMGNSEARLHKMGGQQQKAKLDRAAKSARTRLEQLEKVETPWRNKEIAFDLHAAAIHSPVLVSVNGVSKAYGERSILENCRFCVTNGQKTALVGGNGAGKTTLLEMIEARAPDVVTCARLKTGFFRQDLSTIDPKRSVLDNVMDETAYEECFVRTILARLLFRRDALHHGADTLSGGERLKLALAKIILSDFNLLVLDEPTNYLDTASRMALEEVLRCYPGAVLFVSHDRAFLNAVADRIVFIRDRTTQTFEGGWEAFTASQLSGRQG